MSNDGYGRDTPRALLDLQKEQKVFDAGIKSEVKVQKRPDYNAASLRYKVDSIDEYSLFWRATIVSHPLRC